MNNRYLFRAKRIDTGEWVIWNILTGMPHDVKISETTICQCTGLKDKNGKLIFENDIMVGHLDDMFPENATYVRVMWHNNGFYTRQIDRDDYDPFDELDQNYFEVCGNVFDNPELLEEG